MLKRKLLAAFIMILSAFVILSSAQTVKRVKFKKGATQATVTGYFKNSKSTVTYLVRVKEGQTLTVEQIGVVNSHAVSYDITNPSGEDVDDEAMGCNSSKTFEDTASGDYKIQVFECRKGELPGWSGSFKLKFTVK
jgi:hypothetical protein